MEENTNNGTSINGTENEDFVPRFKDSVGTTANRRRIKILQQVGDEMIVEITNETTSSERGTALTAQMMNEFDRRVFDAEKNSTSAKRSAESAEQKAADALQHASDNRGTMIYAGGELKQTFNMDDKADKQATNQAINGLGENLKKTNQVVSAIKECPIMTEVEYDSREKAFIFN